MRLIILDLYTRIIAAMVTIIMIIQEDVTYVIFVNMVNDNYETMLNYYVGPILIKFFVH